MNESTTPPAAETSLSQDVLALLKYRLGGRRTMLVLAFAALGAGAYLNWSWLVVTGIAPVIVAIAPCAAMCALGLCMKGGNGATCSSGNAAPDDTASGPEGAERLGESLQRKENDDA